MTLAIQDRIVSHFISLQKSFLWECEISGISTRTVNLLVDKVTFPYSVMETEGWAKGATKEYFPLTNDVGDITLNMRETETGEIRRFLETWLGQQRNPDGTYNYPKNYKRTITLKQLSGNHRTVNKFEAKGVFIKNIEDVSLTYEESAIFMFVIILSCDSITLSGIEGGFLNNLASDILNFRSRF